MIMKIKDKTKKKKSQFISNVFLFFYFKEITKINLCVWPVSKSLYHDVNNLIKALFMFSPTEPESDRARFRVRPSPSPIWSESDRVRVRPSPTHSVGHPGLKA
jgi:hypothetical protein